VFTRSLNISFVSSWTLRCGSVIVTYPATCIIFLNIGPFFYHGQQPPVGQDLLIIKPPLSNSYTPHSTGLLWTSDQPDVETPIWQRTTLVRDRHHAPGGIRTHNPNKRAATDPRLRPRGHWNQQTQEHYSDEFRVVGKWKVGCNVMACWEMSWNPRLLAINRLSTAAAGICILISSRAQMFMLHSNGLHKEAQVDWRIPIP